jgi:hypothetical protein
MKEGIPRGEFQSIDKVLRTLSMGFLWVKMPLMAAFFPPI